MKNIFAGLNEMQLQSILKGLSKSENVEKRLNQLYTYSHDPEKSMIITKLVDQAVNSLSTKALVILGIMLVDCMANHSDPSYTDVIVMGALKSATDYDIQYIKQVCEQYVDDDGFINEKRIDESQYAKEYNRVLSWASSNRIISKKYHRRIEEHDFDVFGEFLVVDECTERLLYYIEEAKQVLNYGKKQKSMLRDLDRTVVE